MKNKAKNIERKKLIKVSRKIVLMLFILLLSLVVALILNKVRAGTFDITLTQLSGQEYQQGAVAISWPSYDYVNKNFKIYRSNGGPFESIGLDYRSVTRVRLLQIYPHEDAANQLKSWIVDTGYGKGIITVNSVFIDDFNNNPMGYLQTNGSWNYDVIFFGTWDSNNLKGINQAAVNAVERYIRAGKGVIFGHDTIAWIGNSAYPGQPVDLNTGFNQLAHYANITSNTYWVNGISDATNTVKIVKKGLFTTYPNYIGDIGKVLTVPVTHNVGQTANGDIWLKLINQDQIPESSNGNFYLTTYNNCASIMTGHSSNQATPDEQKILSNLVFYMNQLLFNAQTMNDAAAIDVAAPDAPTINFSNNVMNFTSYDNGSTYRYYVESYSKDDTSAAGLIDRSGEKSITVTSGLANYRYIYDNNPNTTVTLSANSSTGRVPLDTTVRYLHVAAVDNAGNIGPTSTVKVVPYKVNHYKQNLDLTSYTLVNGDSYTGWGIAGTVVHPEVKIYDGYVSPSSQSATLSADENTVVNYYYTRRTDLTYDVNYLEYGTNQVLATAKTASNRLFGETITCVNEKIDIYGYKYYAVSPAYLTITTGNNVINVYYQKRSDLKYIVRYKDKETNEEIHSRKVVENQTYLSVINPQNDKISISGYVFDSIVPNTLSISVDESLNVVDILYTKRKDISYQVNYLDVDTNQVIHPTEVVRGQTYNSVINGDRYKIGIDGYQYNSINPAVLILGADSSYNIMNVYYKKRSDLTYTINYYLENTVTKLHESKVATNQTFGNRINTDNEIITISGYNFVSASADSITIQTDNSRNVINIYYKQQTGIQYTVNYYLNGTSTKIKKSKYVSAQFDDVIEALDEKVEIPGYVYTRATPMTLRVTTDNDRNVINIYYDKRTDLEYTVEYLIKDSPHVMIKQSKVVKRQTLGNTITASSEVEEIDGFIYSTAHPSTLTIGPNNEENILSIYYTRRPDLSYTVNYLDNQTRDKIRTSKLVTGMDFEREVFSSYEVINIDGFEYVNSDVDSIIISVNETQNVINLYYQRLNNLSYKVNYVDRNSGALLREQKVVGNQSYGAQINSTREMVDIPGYNFTSASPSTLIVGTGENIITLYYTARNDLYYTVNYFIKDTRIKIQQSKVVRNQTFGSSIIADNEIMEIDRYRYVGKDKEVLTIDSEVSNNYINLYYSRISNVNIKYLDKYSGEELATTNTITGLVGEEYNIGPYYQELEGYELIERPESLTGVYTNEDTNICFYYAKVVSVISKYLDKYTGEAVFDQTTIEGYVGKEYQTYMVTIPGYRYIDKNGNERGRMIDGTIVVTYYYSKESAITVVQRDPSTNEIIGQYTIDGYEGMPYTVEEPEVEGYTFVRSEGQTEGVIPKDGNVVTLYYAKNANLTVRYENYYTREEIDTPLVTEEYEGKEYSTSRKNIPGWSYIDNSGNTVGRVGREGTEVIYYYAKSTTIKVNYVDATTGEELASSRTIEGYVGQEYSVNPISINGYVYSESSGDDTTGQMEERQLRITFKYLKASGLIVKYVDMNNEEEISEERYFEGYSSYEYDVTDERKDIRGYTYIRDSGNTRGVFQNPVTEVIYYYAKTSRIIARYVDMNTNEEIADETEYYGYEGKGVSIIAKEINGYTKVRSDKEVPSEIGREEETITFYYVKNSSITIKYVDYSSRQEIATRERVNGYEGKNYDLSSYKKNINNYYLLYEPEQMRGQFAREDMTVTFFYGKETKLIIKYVDRNTKQEISDKSITKHHSGERYNLKEYEKDINGYLLMDTPQEEGIIMDEDLVLTFYYAKRVSITVLIKDPDTGEVIETKIIEGHEGKDYNIVIDKIDGYEFDGSNAPTSGQMAHENGVIELYYKKVKDKDKDKDKEEEKEEVNPETEDETTAPVILPQTGETIYIVVATVVGVTGFGIFAFIKQKED